MTVDASAFDAAVAAASALLDAEGGVYDPEVFIDYTRRIIEGMGGSGPGRRRARPAISTTPGRRATTSRCTRRCPRCCAPPRAGVHDRPDLEHAALAEDVRDALRSWRAVHGRDFLVRPRLHEAAPAASSRRRCAGPASSPREAVMVGDSVPHDIDGRARPRHARRSSSRGPGTSSTARRPRSRVIQSLRELQDLL